MSEKETKKLFCSITNIGDDIIENALDSSVRKQKKKRAFVKWIPAIAACMAVIIGCISVFPRLHAPGGAEIPSEGGSGHEDGAVFMSYAGPVFPLTLAEKNVTLSAVRNVDYDFITYRGDSSDIEMQDSGEGVTVKDDYKLSNGSQSDIAVTAVYPFAGNFQTEIWPAVTVNGNNVEYRLHAGTYTGSFKGAGDESSESLNLDNITSWTGYGELLSDGGYFAEAFAAPEGLDMPAVVYRLSDLTDGGSGYDAATLCMSFKYDPEKTSVMTWGFNGAGIREDTGEEYRDFFIREGRRQTDEDVKYFAVLGGDIESYTLQGYRDGSCAPGKEIEGASAAVTREETTVGELLMEIAKTRYNALAGNEFDGDSNRFVDNRISFETYYQAIVKHFAAYGPFGTDSKERYESGMLDDIINETAYNDRIFYLSFDITVPAGESVDISVEQFKNASFDFRCSDSENVGINGYDMVTSLGSDIAFDRQTASVSNYGTVEIVRQNFGFDTENGITSVELDMNEPHFYMEVRKAKEK